MSENDVNSSTDGLAASRRQTWWWVALGAILVATGLVYWPSLHAPFIFDDLPSIVENESIRALWPLWGDAERGGPLAPPRNRPVSARPLVNLSFAVNYQWGELEPGGYRAVNYMIHMLNVVLLAKLAERSLRLPYFGGKFGNSAGAISLVIAALWALHPLVTETVVYVTQRTELMATFFYLATLLASLRFLESRSVRWLVLAVVACWAGMASKEVVVTAPVLVLFFDRTFFGRSGRFERTLREAWSQSKPLYVGLFSSWLLMLSLAGSRPIDASAGFHLGVSAVDWWYTQCQVLLMYLRLAVWPWPLSIHYEPPYLTSFAAAWTYVLPVAVLVVGTLVLLWRRSAVGWLGTLALSILAPTLVIPVVTEIAAERRMYLPLAALVTMLVAGGYVLLQRVMREKVALWAIIVVGAGLTLVGAMASRQRLELFADELALWQDVLTRDPRDATAQYNTGTVLLGRNEPELAAEHFRRAIALRDDYPQAHHNYGSAWAAMGNQVEADREYKRAVEVGPHFAMGRVTLGLRALDAGRIAEAKKEFEAALRWSPLEPGAHTGMAEVLLREGNGEAAEHYGRTAVNSTPDSARAHNVLGAALAQQGKLTEAIEQLELTVKLDPNFLQAQGNLMAAYASLGRKAEALAAAEKALALAKSQGNKVLEEQIEMFLFDYRLGAGREAAGSE